MPNAIQQKIEEYQRQIDKGLRDPSKPWSKYFDSLEQTTGVKRTYILVALVTAVAVFLSCGLAAGLICNTIGFVYPAYMSMKALESPQQDDDKRWLTYWVVFASFNVLEYFSNFIVSFFPLYWLAKCLFIVWCFIPGDMNGAMIIYRRVLRPYYFEHHQTIDDAASTVINAVKPQAADNTRLRPIPNK